MRKHEGRLSAGCIEDATARVWDKHPGAMAIVIKYLYCGWWEYQIKNPSPLAR